MKLTRENIFECPFLYTDTEIRCKTSLECIADCLERGDASEITSVSSQSTPDEETNDELILFEPDNPLMDKFQNTLQQHLLKQRDSIRNELLAFVSLSSRTYCRERVIFQWTGKRV